MQGVLEEVALLQEITEACRGAVRAFVEDRTDSDGRVSQDSLNNFARSIGFGQQPWTKALQARFSSPYQYVLAEVSTWNAASLPLSTAEDQSYSIQDSAERLSMKY